MTKEELISLAEAWLGISSVQRLAELETNLEQIESISQWVSRTPFDPLDFSFQAVNCDGPPGLKPRGSL